MVSGGTYGIEDVVHGAGYGRAILILLLTPILWSLPTAYMIGELSSALPAEGGFYAWVRRAMGDFWGFQEAWLSLVASIFDMAIYPTLVRALSDAALSLVRREQSRRHGGTRGGHRLRGAEHRRHSRGRDYLGLAVLSAFGSLCGHRHSGALQVRGAGERGHDSHNVARRHHRRPADRHVELHGMGQCLDHRRGSEAAATHLSRGP